MCFLLSLRYAAFFQQGRVGWDIRSEVLAFTLTYAGQVLLPASLGIAVPLVVSLMVWPQFVFLEFNRLLSEQICAKLSALYAKIDALYFHRRSSSDPEEFKTFLENIFEEQSALFSLAERLPYLVTLANIEGAWTLTNLGEYHQKVLRPMMQLTYVSFLHSHSLSLSLQLSL